MRVSNSLIVGGGLIWVWAKANIGRGIASHRVASGGGSRHWTVVGWLQGGLDVEQKRGWLVGDQETETASSKRRNGMTGRSARIVHQPGAGDGDGCSDAHARTHAQGAPDGDDGMKAHGDGGTGQGRAGSRAQSSVVLSNFHVDLKER